MSTSPDLTCKVRQRDNDVQSIYELLTGISATQQRQGNRLEELGDQLEGLANQLEGLASEQASQNEKFDAVLALLRDDGGRLR
ncbi:MAG: hypothetical protein ACYC1D_13040 [Acidimicrobiales bacterium]